MKYKHFIFLAEKKNGSSHKQTFWGAALAKKTQ